MSFGTIATGVAAGAVATAAFAAPIWAINRGNGGDSGQQPFVAMVILGGVGVLAGGGALRGAASVGSIGGIGGKLGAIAGLAAIAGIGGAAMGGAVWLARPKD